MGIITFTIIGLIFQLFSFFILFYSSMTGHIRLVNKFCLTHNTLNRFGRFVQNNFRGENQTVYVGIKRFFYTISALIFVIGSILQIIGLLRIEDVTPSEISLIDILPIVIIIIIIILFSSWIILKSKRELITTLFSVLVVFLASLSVIYAYQTINWYQNPQPLYQSWTNVDSEIRNDGIHTVSIWTGYSPHEGLNSPLTGWNNFKIKVYINNAGRAPITGTIVGIDISTENLAVPFPFKIYTIRTPVQWIEYDFTNKTLVDSFGQERTGWVNEYLVSDFPPVLKVNGNEIKKLEIWDFRVGTIAPENTVEIEIGLFAAQNNATGELELTITSENEPDHNIVIPLKSN